jgi:hypothetical protein
LTLARGVVDASVRCWYLLEGEITPKERTRRLMNDRLFAMFEQDTLLGHEPVFADTLARNNQTKGDIQAGARRYNLHFTDESRTADDYRPTRLGSARPATVELLRRCVRMRESANAFYRMSSGLTHAALHVLPGRVRFDAGRHRVSLEPLDVDRVVADCVPPLVATLVTLSTVLGQTGWEQNDFNQRADETHALWSKVIDSDT